MIGSTVNPALGRIDYSPIVQGAQSAAQSIQNAGQVTGQMYANLGKQISGGFEQYQKNKEERDFYETAVRSKMGEAIQSMNQYKANPKLYGDRAPIRPEMLESISVEDIPKISIGKLKSYANELDGILQKSRGALAEANAIRQAERDLKAIADNKFFTQAYGSAQKMEVPTGDVIQEKIYRAPTAQEGRSNLGNILSSANYGKSMENKSIVPGVKFNLPESKPIPDSVKNFIIVNPVTGAAQLNTDVVSNFNKAYDEKTNQVRVLETIVKDEARPVFGMTGAYGVQQVGTRPTNSAEKVASNNLYANAQSELSRLAEAKKAIDEAQKFVQKDSQGATPAEIKTYISKDPNLTPLQSASFDLVTKPEFRDATAQEKTDKVLSEYINKGGELSPEFLAKVKTAFKTDIEKTDLGGGKIAVTYGNNIAIVDANKKNERIPLGEIKKFEQDNYQNLLNKIASTYPSWDSVPDQAKALLASLTAVYGPKDFSGMTASPLVAFNSRREALRGTPAPTVPNPILSKPISAASGWSIAR
jgi:hypothetical protein